MSGKNETVKTFHVENINRLSDHCCTSVYLQKGEGWVKEETLVTEIDASSVREKKLLFNQQYENLINSAEVRETARKVLCNINTNLGKESIDTVTQKVVDIIINVAKSCEVIGGGKERFKRKHKKRNNREPWFNLDCRKLKRNLDYISKALSRNPMNNNLRGRFFAIKKQYKKLIKKRKKKYNESIIQELENCSTKGNEFWKKYKSLKNKNKITELPNPSELQEHFSNLYTNNDEGENWTSDESGLTQRGICNLDITISEIKTHIKKLKNKKKHRDKMA